MLELREQRTARVGKFLECLPIKSQNRVVTWYTAPLENLMERAELVASQPQELSALPVQDEPKSRSQLPRRSRLVAYLAGLMRIPSNPY